MYERIRLLRRQVWSAEEEYLIMKVTLNAVRILRQWMQRCDAYSGRICLVVHTYHATGLKVSVEVWFGVGAVYRLMRRGRRDLRRLVSVNSVPPAELK